MFLCYIITILQCMLFSLHALWANDLPLCVIYKTEYQYIAGIVTFGKTESDVKILVLTLKSKRKRPV